MVPRCDALACKRRAGHPQRHKGKPVNSPCPVTSTFPNQGRGVIHGAAGRLWAGPPEDLVCSTEPSTKRSRNRFTRRHLMALLLWCGRGQGKGKESHCADGGGCSNACSVPLWLLCVCVCVCVCVCGVSLRIFLSPLFLLCSCFCGSHCVCVCVSVARCRTERRRR